MTKLFKKHPLLILGIFITLTLAFIPASAMAEINVLLLPDVLPLWDTNDDTMPGKPDNGTAALVDALEAAGYVVEVGPIEYEWDGTNPPLEGFDVVIHLNGATWFEPLPVQAQKDLVAFVENGGGFIGGQFNGFEQVAGEQKHMEDLVLQLWPHPDNCIECLMIWTVVPGQEDHPVLEGIPASFTFFADAHDAGPQVIFDEFPSTVLMRSKNGGPAVIVREFKEGRIVSFSHAPNASTDLTLQDPNIQQLYINAVAWAAPEEPEPEITIPDLIGQVKTLVDEEKMPRLSGLLHVLELKIALRHQDEGHLRKAVMMLSVFERHVQKLVDFGRLAPEDGQLLIDGATAIIERLREEIQPDEQEELIPDEG